MVRQSTTLTSCFVMYIGLLRMIHTVLSQQPGCVVDPSYVINASVFGRSDLREMCLIGVEEPANENRFYNLMFHCH